MNTMRHGSARLFLMSIAVAVPASAGAAERLERPNAAPAVGKLSGDRTKGFRFVPADGSAPIEPTRGASVAFEPEGPTKFGPTPPFHVVVGRDQRISGRLASADSTAVRLEDGPGGKPVAVRRSGAVALLQRSGEIQVIEDGFESLDAGRWTTAGSGAATVSDAEKLAGARALALPPGGTSVTARLADPVGQGRFEVAFFDDGRSAVREQAVVELLFRGELGPESLRAVLGWSEATLAVESPGGPALAVQPLVRRPGWRRLGVRFAPDKTEVAVDGDELAHGKGPRGPLIEIRLATRTIPGESAATPKGLTARFDDLRLVRFASPGGEMEADPEQDEVRLVDGDQIFGSLAEAGPERLTLVLGGKRHGYRWSEVAGVRFARAAAASDPVSGLLVRVEWRSAPGNDPRDTDAVEGALVSAGDDLLAIETPQAGTVEVPRSRIRRLRVIGEGTRVVLDPFAHHLGDDVSEAPERLDPPQPEGGVLERTFELGAAPAGAARLVIDAVQVVGESPTSRFANKIREGELRTNLYVNGVLIDYLNRYIVTNNETPETVRVPIPRGTLKAGRNVVRLNLVGMKSDPTFLDDLGILGLAVDMEGTIPAPRPTR